ncbi:hypothetical protein SGRA_3665 [Saprospira grandis str. Lewin]|uniref:Uncharacterized protein n=1 Tax=Saprospira grandis (strain Lewin) TaxID=984262 RepID=H6L6V6_SAPGL|nr:hypothetical protein SGRA_3665 [Saprospira grandis str. Lewin]
MCSSGRRPDRASLLAKGRASSELRNVAPAAGGRPQKKQQQQKSKNYI